MHILKYITIFTYHFVSLTKAKGFFSNVCGFVQRADVDPIVNIGTKAAHTHDILGSCVLTSTSTADDLLNASCSTCLRQGDKSAYWFPTIYQKLKNGSEVALSADFISVYYQFPSDSKEIVNPMPNGLKMIMGKAQPANVTENNSIFFTKLFSKPFPEMMGQPVISEERGFAESVDQEVRSIMPVIFSPECLKGPTVLDSPDHISHTSKVGPDGKCPPDFPYRIPLVNFHPVFNLAEPAKWTSRGDMPFRLSVDSEYGNMYKFHLDLFFAWDQSVLKELIGYCKENDCHKDTSANPKTHRKEPGDLLPCIKAVKKQVAETPLEKLFKSNFSVSVDGHSHIH